MRECGIVRDLLPLYQEGMLGPDSVEFVEEHLKTCPACRAERESLGREAIPEQRETAAETAALASVRRKLLRQRGKTVFLAVFLVLALATAAFARLTERHYFSDPKGILTVSSMPGSGEKVLRFSGGVTGADCTYERMEGGKSIVFLSIWWTEWDRMLGNTLQEMPAPAGNSVYLSPNNGTDDILLWGQNAQPGGGIITLPRLALGYYALLAGGLLVLLGVLAAALRKKPCGSWLRRAALLPAAYLLGELLVMGFTTVTYSMERDFALIAVTAVFLYPALLLGGSLWEERKRRALPREL